MNLGVARSLMNHLDDGSLKVGHAPKSVQQALELFGLPESLLRLVQWDWPQEEGLVGPIRIFPADRIATEPKNDNLLPVQLLLIGRGLNGDSFVVNFSSGTCPVGFLPHEECDWEGDLRQSYQPAARSIESFLYRVAEGRFFPVDYYAAGDFNDFLREEAEHQTFPPYDRKA